MRRRAVIAIAGTALVAWPLVAGAQQQARTARLGYLGFGSPTNAIAVDRIEALRAGLRDLGYVEGKNLVIEFRWSDTVEQLHEAAVELVRMKVDIIFSGSSTETEQARRATAPIPIVFATHADPVGVGHVASLVRPGGNITGLSALSADRTGKQLEILKATVPRATRFGVLNTPTTPAYRTAGLRAGGQGLRRGIQSLRRGSRRPGRPVSAFDECGRESSVSHAETGSVLGGRRRGLSGAPSG